MADMLAAALADIFRCASRGAEQRAIGPALAVADEADAISGGIGRHFQNERNVHAL
jgi:hypothetical protein